MFSFVSKEKMKNCSKTKLFSTWLQIFWNSSIDYSLLISQLQYVLVSSISFSSMDTHFLRPILIYNMIKIANILLTILSNTRHNSQTDKSMDLHSINSWVLKLDDNAKYNKHVQTQKKQQHTTEMINMNLSWGHILNNNLIWLSQISGVGMHSKVN